MTKILHKSKNDKGSATIEAVVAFMGFLFTIFTILNIVNFCRTQALISNAIDTTAKEMSQYGYLYKMSGLQKFSENVAEKGEIGASRVNDVISSVDTLYGSLTDAVDGTVSRGTEISNAINDNSLDMDKIQSIIDGVKADGSNVQSAINLVSANMNNIISNPVLYIKSLVAVAANGAMDKFKSQVIAVPLAKAFFVKHFGDSAEEASEYLESLGVVGGLEGMNFNNSTMFSSDSSNDIHIVVYYKLQMIQLFKFAEMNATIKKEALVGGWLGGDNVLVTIKEETTAAPPEGTQGENSGNEETTNEETTNEETTNEETTIEETVKVDTEGSYWHLPTCDEDGYDQQCHAFITEVMDATGIQQDTAGVHMYGRNSKNEAYGVQYCVDADSARFIGDNVAHGMAMIHEFESPDSTLLKKYENGSTVSYTCFVYVPENISDEELAKVQQQIKKDFATAKLYQEQTNGVEFDIPVSIQVLKGGGNYDYGG